MGKKFRGIFIIVHSSRDLKKAWWKRTVETEFGQTVSGQNLGVLDVWHYNCLGHGPKPRKSGDQKGGARRVGARRVGGPKFRAFFPSPATIFILSSLSWGSFRGIWVLFLKAGGCCDCCGWVWLEWDSTANKMVQRCEEFGHLVFISISALECGNKGKAIVPFISQDIQQTQIFCSKQFILWISSIFTEQWRTCVINSIWQKEKRCELICVDKKMQTSAQLRRSTTLDISSDNDTCKQDARKRVELQSTV